MTTDDESDPREDEDKGPAGEATLDASDSPESESRQREATPQSAALRRQQYAVGIGAAIIAGFALAISSLQHFPSLPDSVPILAGFVGAGLVYWIVRHSLYPTDGELSASE